MLQQIHSETKQNFDMRTFNIILICLFAAELIQRRFDIVTRIVDANVISCYQNDSVASCLFFIYKKSLIYVHIYWPLQYSLLKLTF